MNSTPIKSAQELAIMRRSGALLAEVFGMLDDRVKVGITTLEINAAVEDFIRNTLKARPSSIGQYGYPFALNASLNDEVCHGVPNARRTLRDGDILNLDITLEKDGFITDSSKMYRLGKVTPAAHRLIDTAYEAMWAGIRTVRPGSRIGDIGSAVQRHAEAAGYSVVREYCGHGVGRKMHEEPSILHYGRPGTGLVLKPGMVFTVEPMINQGTAALRHRNLSDGWSIALTKDRKLSAQWEHTVAVTETGFEVLTLRPEERANAALGGH